MEKHIFVEDRKQSGRCYICFHPHNSELHDQSPLVSPPAPAHSANTRQVGGSHYKTGGEEHWDRVSRLGLDYFQGQITKYVERWKKKNGVQDLEKARHFLDKYIELNSAKSDGESPGAEALSSGYANQDGSNTG